MFPKTAKKKRERERERDGERMISSEEDALLSSSFPNVILEISPSRNAVRPRPKNCNLECGMP
jgi:hypothetical protein